MTRARNSANLASHGNLFVDIANDRTGIGSVVPAQNLHVAGTAGFHADVTLTGDLYNATWDRSADSLRFNDGAQIKLGTGNDANIRHDGSNTWIQNSTGYLYIDAAGSSGGIRLISHAHWQAGAMAAFYKDGGVQLFHDANYKFSTETYGTNTVGTAVNDGLVVAGVATVTTMNVTGVLTYDDVTSVDSVGIVTARQGVRVTADGGNTTNYISVGAGDDLRLYHDGNGDSNIFNNTGHLTITNNTSGKIINLQPKSGANGVIARYEGAVELYHNNNLRVQTDTSSTIFRGGAGIRVYGDASANQNGQISIHPTGSAVYTNLFFYNAAGNSYASIIGHAGNTLFFTGGTNGPLRFRVNGSGHHSFQDGNTEKVRITVGGEVNIGGNFTQTTVPLCVTTDANDYGIRLMTGSNVVCEILNNDSAGNSEIRGYYNNNSGTRGEGYRLEANGETFFNPGGNSGLQITSNGNVVVSQTLFVTDSIQHHGDNDTRIRFPAADTIQFETAGVNRVGITTRTTIASHTGTVENRGQLSVRTNGNADATALFIGSHGSIPSTHASGSATTGVTTAIYVESSYAKRPEIRFHNSHSGNWHDSPGNTSHLRMVWTTPESDSTPEVVEIHPRVSGNASGAFAGLRIRVTDNTNGLRNCLWLQHNAQYFYVNNSGTLYNDSNGTGIAANLYHIGDTDTKLSFPTDNTITAITGGTERVRIDSSGRVLIGTTTEGFAEADDLTINSADHGGITIRTPTNKEGNIAFSDSTSGTGEYSGLIRYRHSNNDLGLWTNSNLRLLINSSGHVVPGSDSSYDLGLTGTRWRNLYADTLYGDGSNLTGITQTTINNNADNRVITGSGTANTLNAESTLTFNAGSLVVNSNNTISGSSIITYSPNGSVRWQMGVDNSNGVDLTSKNTSGSYNTYNINAGNFTVKTTGTNSPVQRFKIDGNGNIKHDSAGGGLSYFQGSSEYIFGSSTSSPPSGGAEAKLQVHENKTRVTLSVNAYMNNAGAPILQFVSSRSGTKGTLGTKSALNDYHGDIRFMGDNGTNNNTLVQSAQILVRQTTTISDGDTVCGGEMQFWTGTATGGSISQRLQIDRNGRLTLSNSEGILLSAKASSLYSLDGSLSYYATNNGVYLNGAGANGWLRLNASGVTNSRTCIDIYGQSHTSADIILFKTNSGERMRILQNGQIEVKADEGIFLKPVTNGGAGGTNGARIRFSDNSGASHNQIGEFRYKHGDSSVVSAAQNDGVNSNDAFHLFGSEPLTLFRVDASTHIYNDYGLWVKTTTQGGLSSNGARIRFSSNPSTNYNQIGEISYLHDDDGITTGFVDGFRIKGSDGQANQQYGAQKTIVKVNGSLQATGNVWGVGSVCQIVRGTDQIINNQNPNQSLQEIASGFRTSITLRTVNPYIKVTFYANPELDGASMRSAIYFYVKKNSGGYGQFQRPVWFGSTTDSGNQQGGYSMLGVVGQVTGNRGDIFTFSPYWAEEANSTAQYMFGQTWSQWGVMASFMYLEEIATQ